MPTATRAPSVKMFLALAGAVAVLAGALGFWALRSPRERRLNVLLVTIDTLRADHLGSYGYAAAQTPALDRLAARGLRFAQAATVAPLTLPAHSSLMTGTFPAFHGVRDNGGFYLGDDQVTLAKVLRAGGYRTGGFVSAFVLDHRWGIGQGFDRYYDDFDLAKYRLDVGLDAVQRPGSEVVSKAIEWLDQDSTRPFLAWVHLYEPHAPYDPPESIRVRFPPTMIGAYDAEIATADIQVGRLIDHLATAGRLDRTVVVVLGDHGESLGEHGEEQHGFFVYDATVRIPLIVAGPGVPSRVIGDQVRIVDVMPTLLEMLGVETPKSVQGRSLLPLARGERLDLVALSETWYPRHHYGWSELTAIRDGRYHFIAAPRRELYDTQTDPGETHNLADVNPSGADIQAHALQAFVARTSGHACVGRATRGRSRRRAAAARARLRRRHHQSTRARRAAAWRSQGQDCSLQPHETGGPRLGGRPHRRGHPQSATGAGGRSRDRRGVPDARQHEREGEAGEGIARRVPESARAGSRQPERRIQSRARLQNPPDAPRRRRRDSSAC